MRFLREKKGLSTRRLSQLAGLSPSYVSKLESGQIDPSFEGFAALAMVLGMTTPEVMLLLRSAAAQKLSARLEIVPS